MRKSHVIGFVIVSLLTVGSIAQAQTAAPRTPQARQQRGGRIEGGRGRLLHGIKLSDAEKERAEIRTALTAEHQTQFDANMKQLDQRRAGRKNGGRGHRAPKAGGVGASKS